MTARFLQSLFFLTILVVTEGLITPTASLGRGVGQAQLQGYDGQPESSQHPDWKDEEVAITWNPERLEITTLPGTYRSVSVEFSPDRDVSNVKVRVTPELRAFVSSDVNAFSKLKAGTWYQLSLVVSLPRSFGASELQGAIHLEDERNHRPIPGHLRMFLSVVPPGQTVANVPTTVALPSNDRISTDTDLHVAAAYVTDEVDLLFTPSVDDNTIEAVVSGIDGRFLGSVPALKYYQILVSPSTFAGLLGLASTVKQNPAVLSTSMHFIFNSLVSPNDPGTMLSYVPALINLPQAWDITTGVKTLPDGSQLKIGVIDNVFDYTNPDLAPNIAHQTPNNTSLSLLSPRQHGQHGTRVASIVGAVSNNDLGIAGVMWNASMYLYSAGTASGGNDGSLLVQLVGQAIHDQVRVVNWSIGGDCVTCTATDLAALAQTVIQWSIMFGLTGNQVLWVVAAGNDGVPIQQSTAQVANLQPNVVAVSAVSSSRTLWNDPVGATDYGTGLIAAPGVEIYSDIPGGGYDNGTSCSLLFCLDEGYATGTSFAAPHVTGVAGLILSVNPSLTPSQLKNMLQNTALDTGRKDPAGNEVMLLDAYTAVSAALPGAVIFSNLGPNNAFGDITTNAGGAITATQSLAVSFTPTSNAQLSSIEIAVDDLSTLAPNSGFVNSYRVSIVLDSSGLPGSTIVESIGGLVFPPYKATALTIVPSLAHPQLSAGTTYWVVVEPNMPGENVNGDWYGTDTGAIGGAHTVPPSGQWVYEGALPPSLPSYVSPALKVLTN